MYKIEKHPILEIHPKNKVTFKFNDEIIECDKGTTIAAALHQAGFPVHSHSLKGRNRSLECGIGKCSACEMLVDNQIRRICVTKVDGIKEVKEIPKNYVPIIESDKPLDKDSPYKIYNTAVAIIGAGPAGLAARKILNEHNVDNILVDSNEKIGGQFNMQTHQFFFFEKEKRFGGMRGFDIAKELAGKSLDGIILNKVVWDVLENKRIALKDLYTDEISYIESDYLIVATGAMPFLPTFDNDDVPGVFSASVVQKMMNTEFTLLGKNVLTVGAGNIGYLTSYQLMQAGANVKAIIEAQDFEGGFPVQANRIKRLGIPIYTSHTLVKAIPNKNNDGVVGAVIAKCKNFEPIKGTEKIIDGIDLINICTGLRPDNLLLKKGEIVFGRECIGAGDAIRIGEGTSAVLRGQQAAYEVLDAMGKRYDYNKYLEISKEYIDSQQRPTKVLEKAVIPKEDRLNKPFVVLDCIYGFACNPCSFSCPQHAITKTATNTTPVIDYNKCIGCMQCINKCPGLAIFGYNLNKNLCYFPIEYEVNEGEEVFLVNNDGEKLGEGVIRKILQKENKTNVVIVESKNLFGKDLTNARGFIIKDKYPNKVEFKDINSKIDSETYVCHCEDVTLEEILDFIGDRKSITIEEIKHNVRLGMGTCRGSRCISRLKLLLAQRGISIVRDATPRAPLSYQINMGKLYPKNKKDKYITNPSKLEKKEVNVLIAGGGMGGSSLFRYFSEAKLKPVLVNNEMGSSWRNIAGGRPAFSVPELADIAKHNHELFKDLQKVHNINYFETRYITFAHDQETYNNLELSKQWSDAYMVDPKDFDKEISPYINKSLKDTYISALVSKDCWQATPGIVVNLLRNIGLENGGTIKENCELIDVQKDKNKFIVLVRNPDFTFTEYTADHFVNALGSNANTFARKVGFYKGLYPVKHQAYITKKLPFMGINGNPLDMLIDRQNHRGFVAVYGQQLAETGQIILCASPAFDPQETNKSIKYNSKEFFEIIGEVFVNWLPLLQEVGIQASWAGYYTEPRMIIDPDYGLFIGLKGHGFMLSQYLAKMYVDKYLNKKVPDYFSRLSVNGDGLLEEAFK